jgi:hypothetical protein
MSRLPGFIATFVAISGLAVAGAGAASAAAPPTPSAPSENAGIQRLVDQKMKLVPGGRQVAPNKIVWDKLGASMEFGTFGPETCPNPQMCVYGDSNFNDGPDVTPWKLNFWACGDYDLGTWGVRNQASSVANHLASGTWGALHQYRDESHPEWGKVQVWGGWAPASDGAIASDRADVVDVC